MSEQVTMSVGVALVLGEVTKMLLYKKIGENDGQPVYEDRDLPFRLKYRLNKNKLFFDKDSSNFNQRRLIALAKYGEPTADGQSVVITDPEKRKAFQQEVSDLIDATVTHTISTLLPEDIDLVKDTDMPISPEAMGIFISYMVDDPDLREDVSFNVKLSDNLTKVGEVTEAEENEKKKKVEVNEEAKIVEEKPKTKRKTATKSTGEKKATTKKADTRKEAEDEPKTRKRTKKVSEI